MFMVKCLRNTGSHKCVCEGGGCSAPAGGNVGLGAQVGLDQIHIQVVGHIEGALRVRILRERQALHEVLHPTTSIREQVNWLQPAA